MDSFPWIFFFEKTKINILKRCFKYNVLFLERVSRKQLTKVNYQKENVNINNKKKKTSKLW